jgi:hypothetical protein
MSATKPNVRMRLDAWTYEDYLTFSNAMRTMNLDVAFDLADKIIQSWSYPTPFVAGALRDMNVEEAMRVLRTVLDALNAFAEDINTDEVLLDFSKWSLNRFLEFNKVRESGNSRKTMAMVREVAVVEGLEDNAVPTMTQGVLMIKAVTDAIGAIIAGKN